MAIGFTYFHMISACLMTLFLALLGKVITYSIKKKKLVISALFFPGGMPSSHSAFATSIATSAFLIEGFSTIFFVALGFACIVIYDSFVVRANIEKNFKLLTTDKKIFSKYKIEKLKKVGHTVSEAIAGVILGIIIPLVVWIL